VKLCRDIGPDSIWYVRPQPQLLLPQDKPQVRRKRGEVPTNSRPLNLIAFRTLLTC
jgi:hypothetical protein